MNYRHLTNEEIALLQSQQCRAEDWNTVMVHPDFSTDYLHNVRFSGEVRLGRFSHSFVREGGINMHSGIRNAALHNVEVGDNCLIENINNYIANYTIGEQTIIDNCDLIVVDGKSSFGNGIEVAVLNETGGREVVINDKLSAHTAYIMALYRHRPQLIKQLREIALYYSEKHSSDRGTIGSNVIISNSGVIKGVRIGDNCRIEGVNLLSNGSINSNSEAPVYVGHGVICNDFIISSGSKVDSGATLSRCFVGQACELGHNYSASDSLFFSNCQGENGEACAIFAGPYTVKRGVRILS